MSKNEFKRYISLLTFVFGLIGAAIAVSLVGFFAGWDKVTNRFFDEDFPLVLGSFIGIVSTSVIIAPYVGKKILADRIIPMQGAIILGMTMVFLGHACAFLATLINYWISPPSYQVNIDFYTYMTSLGLTFIVAVLPVLILSFIFGGILLGLRRMA